MLIYTTAVNTVGRAVNDTDIFDVTRQSWEHYCSRYGIDFYVIDEPLLENTSPHWFRYCIFDLKPGYDKYMYIDTDIMTKWDAPNIFDNCDDEHIHVVHDNSGLRWIWGGIKGYQPMFPDIKLEWNTYFNSGVLVFSKHHEQVIRDFKQFYVNNQHIIEEYRNKLKGFDQTDQTIFNYFLIWHGQTIKMLSGKWNFFHMIRREVLYNKYFLDMGYFWHFNDMDRKTQVNSIQQIWNQIKEKYEN